MNQEDLDYANAMFTLRRLAVQLKLRECGMTEDSAARLFANSRHLTVHEAKQILLNMIYESINNNTDFDVDMFLSKILPQY